MKIIPAYGTIERVFNQISRRHNRRVARRLRDGRMVSLFLDSSRTRSGVRFRRLSRLTRRLRYNAWG